MMLSMGTKRVLDETVLEGGEDAPHSDPIDVFHPPPVSSRILLLGSTLYVCGHAKLPLSVMWLLRWYSCVAC